MRRWHACSSANEENQHFKAKSTRTFLNARFEKPLGLAGHLRMLKNAGLYNDEQNLRIGGK